MRGRRDRPPIRAVHVEDPVGQRFRERILATTGVDDPTLYWKRTRFACDADLGTVQFQTRYDGAPDSGNFSILHRTAKRVNLDRGLPWQITRYVDGEPAGDVPYETCEAALKDQAPGGFHRLLAWTRRK